MVIAEKPSVAADLTKALGGKFSKEKTHYEGQEYLVAWALGHLVTIADPGEIDENYKSWNLGVLPIIPEHFQLKPIKNTKSQLTALGKLIRRKDVSTIVNACDAGREGELIFHYIVDHEKGKTGLKGKQIKRLWMQSMTQTAIREAFTQMRDHEEMDHLRDAALSRSEADWLVGINSSRGLTAYNSKGGGFRLTPAGRVQTPTLTLIVKRELERNAFVPRTFWTVHGQFEADQNTWEARWFDPEFKKEESEDSKDNAYRIWEENQAQTIVETCQGKTGNVEETSKPVTQKCPPLYDLTSLQREANSRFGFSAKMTLQIAQALYERHKLTTYPRTDSKFLPEDYLGSVAKTMSTLTSGSYGPHARKVLDENWIQKDYRIFNNKKISDHHAIIPTGNTSKVQLSEPEQKIYGMIVQRFIAIFFPAAIYQNTIRIVEVEGNHFRTEGKVLTVPGWRAVYGKGVEDEKDAMAPLQSSQALAQELLSEADQTRPPARYNESTLLSMMESAGKLVEDDELADAMKERGLGTPATRAAIIEGLLQDKYLVRDGKELLPTAKAIDLVRLSSAMQIEDLTSPELTGEWEHKLGLVEKGEYTREQFMTEIVNLTQRIVSRIKSFKEDDTSTEASFSPVNGVKVMETVTAYKTEDDIAIRKVLGGRSMSPEEVKELLEKRKIGPLDGFRSKRGKEFRASLLINDKNSVEFQFESEATDEAVQNFDASQSEALGNSPVDGSPVHEIGNAYMSLSAIEGDKKGLRISKTILGQELSRHHIQTMLAGEATDLITGFVSSRTRRKFDAKLKLSKAGKIEFDFPPRPAGARRFGKSKFSAKSTGKSAQSE